jgi:hypothetical protein
MASRMSPMLADMGALELQSGSHWSHWTTLEYSAPLKCGLRSTCSMLSFSQPTPCAMWIYCFTFGKQLSLCSSGLLFLGRIQLTAQDSPVQLLQLILGCNRYSLMSSSTALINSSWAKHSALWLSVVTW